jgi:hypothetical protein
MSDQVENNASITDGGEAPAVTENQEPAKVKNSEDGATKVEKALDEMTPEELRAYVEKVTTERDSFKRHSRDHEDEVKKLRPLVEKLQNEGKTAEEVIADKVAALEAKLNAAEKEAAIFKVVKEKNLPDSALPLLQATSLENFDSVVETVVAMLADAAKATPVKPSLPINPAQGDNTSGASKQLTGPELELQELFNRAK